jgi:hypothetical protein
MGSKKDEMKCSSELWSMQKMENDLVSLASNFKN